MGIDAIRKTDSQVQLNTARFETANAGKQIPPAPASALAVPVETARAEVNAASLMTAMMMPTPDSIYVIGSVAVKAGQAIRSVANVNNWASWGFWALIVFVAGAMGASAPAAYADDEDTHTGHSHGLRDRDREYGGVAQDDTGKCYEDYDLTLSAVRIQGGHHVSFATANLLALDTKGVEVDRAILTLVIRGNEQELKNMTLAINGVRAGCGDGKDFLWVLREFFERLDNHHSLKNWWWLNYWQYYLKHAFILHGDRLVISFDLTHFLINSQEHFSRQFERLLKERGSLEISVGGHAFVLDASLRVSGDREVSCTPDPAPIPTPTPTPTPTPIPPTTSIDSKVPTVSPTNSTTMAIAFSSNQTNVTFNCSMDGGAAVLCTSPSNYSGLGNGSHTFKVAATSSAGLTDTTGATYTWSVDTVPPTITIGTATPSKNPTNSTSMSVTFTSSIAGTSFQCSVDGAAAVACASPVSYAGLAEGTHQISISGTDAVGNSSTTPAVYQWRIDLTPPVTNFVSVVPAAARTNINTSTFTFAANEPSTFECSLDNAVWQACTSPLTTSALIEGAHAMSVRATDVAGNVGNPALYSWTVDQTPPIVTLGNVVPVQGITNSKNISVEFTANETATFTCSLDGAVATACTSPFTAAIATEGAHSLVVTGTDVAGNSALPIKLSWTMDFTSPQISFGTMSPSAASFINSTSLTVNVNATEPVYYSSTLDGINLNQTTSPILLTGLSAGAHILVLNAVDYAGNPANTITHTFTVDLMPPVVTLSATLTGTTNQTSNTFTFSASKSVTFQCSLNGAGFAACVSPTTVSGLIDGTHTYQVKGVDLAGNVSNIASVTWTVDTIPPHTTIGTATPAGTIIASKAISVSFSVNEAGATSQCSLDGSAFAACVSPYSATGLADGPHTITIRSIDAAGNVEPAPPSYNFTVDTTPPIITLTSSVPALTNTTSAQFTFTANETATFDCTLDGVVTAGCSSPAAYVNLAQGVHTFSVIAHDVVGNSSAPSSFSWTIDTTPPTTTLTAAQAANNGNSITFTLGSNDPAATFTCSLDGAAFSACSTSVTYTGLAAGNHTFRARATDLAGNIDPAGASYAFTVSLPLTTTITGETPSTSITASTTISFTFTSSDPAATFQCSLDGAAAAACVSPQSYSGLSNATHTFLVQAVRGGTVDTTGASYTWTVDNTPIGFVSTSMTVTSTSMTISWVTNKPTTTMLAWGLGSSTANIVPEDNIFSVNHSVTVTGLAPNTVYSFIMEGHDAAGTFFASTRRAVRTNP